MVSQDALQVFGYVAVTFTYINNSMHSYEQLFNKTISWHWKTIHLTKLRHKEMNNARSFSRINATNGYGD